MQTGVEALPTEQDGPETVLALLGEQALLYGRLESLAARQRTLVSGEDVGPLFQVLADRQRISEQLLHVGDRLAPIRRGWRGYRLRLSPVDRTEADRLWNEARERLQRVMESDEHDAMVLSGRKQAVTVALQAADSNRRAMTAYRSPIDGKQRLDCVHGGD